MKNPKVLAIIWSSIILFLSLVSKVFFSIGGSLNNVVGMDKIVHIFLYGVNTFLWSRALLSDNKDLVRILFLFLGMLAFGFTIEVMQMTLTTDRSFDWYDVVANTIGIIVGITVYLKFR